MKKIRNYIFLRDIFVLAITAFGGPQAHIAMFLDVMVQKRGYVTEKELIELHALCQILPGPTSTQTITAIGFKTGGPRLAFLTLLVWALPAVTVMTLAGLIIGYLPTNLEFARFIQPMAVGFVAFAAYKISSKVVDTHQAIIIMVISAVLSYFYASPYVYPLLILAGGIATSLNFRRHPKVEKEGIKVQWSNFILWGAVGIGAALLGQITEFRYVLLFENFYRNGSLIFGGGQVLIPLLNTEFVELKQYLTSEEFLSGFSFVQALPGPVFSFTAYIGALSSRDSGVLGSILGGFTSATAVFLPGTFLIFFVIRFWEELKKYRFIKASIEGINAASSGMVAAAAIQLFQPLEPSVLNIALVVATFCVLLFTRIPAPFVILAGLLAGIVF